MFLTTVVDLTDPANFERLQWGSVEAQFFIGLGVFLVGLGGAALFVVLRHTVTHDPDKATADEDCAVFFGFVGGIVCVVFGVLVASFNLHTFIKIERAPMVYLQDLKK